MFFEKSKKKCFKKTYYVYLFSCLVPIDPPLHNMMRCRSMWKSIIPICIAAGGHCRDKSNMTYSNAEERLCVEGVRDFSTIIIGGGTAGCTIAYMTAKW